MTTRKSNRKPGSEPKTSLGWWQSPLTDDTPEVFYGYVIDDVPKRGAASETAKLLPALKRYLESKLSGLQ